MNAFLLAHNDLLRLRRTERGELFRANLLNN
jgi:hypothetical protein